MCEDGVIRDLIFCGAKVNSWVKGAAAKKVNSQQHQMMKRQLLFLFIFDILLGQPQLTEVAAAVHKF